MAAEERVIKRNMTEWNFSAMTLLKFFISRAFQTTASPGGRQGSSADGSERSASDFQRLLPPTTFCT